MFHSFPMILPILNPFNVYEASEIGPLKENQVSLTSFVLAAQEDCYSFFFQQQSRGVSFVKEPQLYWFIFFILYYIFSYLVLYLCRGLRSNYHWDLMLEALKTEHFFFFFSSFKQQEFPVFLYNQEIHLQLWLWTENFFFAYFLVLDVLQKNAMIGGAVTGALISAVTNSGRDKIVTDAITGGAIATAAEFINYLTWTDGSPLCTKLCDLFLLSSFPLKL